MTDQIANDSDTRGVFQLAAIDIDGTLLGPNGVLSSDNIAAVTRIRQSGLRVVLASGRSHENMIPFHDALGLEPGPVISAQGAVVRTVPKGDIWFEHLMRPADALAVTREGIARGFSVQQYRRDGIYIQARSRWTDYDQSRNAELQRLIPDLLTDAGAGVLKVIWLGEPDQIVEASVGARVAYGASLAVTLTDPEYLEFYDASVSKAVGLAVTAERLGIPRERVMAFGDGNNDAPMLAWAGVGVAMSHGRESAKRAASIVAPDGDPATALARALDQLVPASP
ncbi:MAG: Cof-type HAD-IIB family hydrolase [Gemmatimonadaceae bacterium]